MELPDHTDLGDVIALGQDLLAAKQYYVAVSALIVYDWILTFNDELRLVWQSKILGPVSTLFLLNRYIPMAFMVVTVFAYFSPLWTFEVCQRFAITEWVQALVISVLAEIVLLLRTHALTGRCKTLAALLSAIIFAQCIIVFYAMSREGENSALPLPLFPIDAFHMCVLYSNPRMDTGYLCLTIIFDLTVFVTTIVVTLRAKDNKQKRSLYSIIRRDGTLYFFVIFTGNFVWMILSLTGRPGVKLMNAQPSMLFTSIMITRLTLSLRRAANDVEDDWALMTFNFPTGVLDDDRESESSQVRGHALNLQRPPQLEMIRFPSDLLPIRFSESVPEGRKAGIYPT